MALNKGEEVTYQTQYTVEQKAREEGWKLKYDICKHLTTLNTGSILILVTFLEKFFAKPNWKVLVVLALASFVISMVVSIMAMNGIATDVRDLGATDRFGSIYNDVTFTGCFAFFLFGILCLVVFAIKNL